MYHVQKYYSEYYVNNYYSDTRVWAVHSVHSKQSFSPCTALGAPRTRPRVAPCVFSRHFRRLTRARVRIMCALV